MLAYYYLHNLARLLSVSLLPRRHVHNEIKKSKKMSDVPGTALTLLRAKGRRNSSIWGLLYTRKLTFVVKDSR